MESAAVILVPVVALAAGMVVVVQAVLVTVHQTVAVWADPTAG